MKIFLIGYMASGKSVVAEKLSQLLDFRFVDTDKWIEARCCKSISEIFSDHGENFFREKEKECLEFLIDHQTFCDLHSFLNQIIHVFHMLKECHNLFLRSLIFFFDNC